MKFAQGLGIVASLILVSCAPQEEPLAANVSNLGPVFIIQNNDSYNWGNCDLYLNSDYSIKGVNIAAGVTFRAMAQDFAKKDGTRFNLASIKPQSLHIACRNAPTTTRASIARWK